MTGSFYRISSSLTLFFKVFIPTVWAVFFGSFMILIFIMGSDLSPVFAGFISKMIYVILFVAFFLLLRVTIIKLKRIELTDEAFYVTNYFKTFRYTYDSLEKVSEMDFILLKILVFRFKTTASFGKKVFCIKRSSVWNEFNTRFPDKLAHAIPSKD